MYVFIDLDECFHSLLFYVFKHFFDFNFMYHYFEIDFAQTYVQWNLFDSKIIFLQYSLAVFNLDLKYQ